MSGLRLDKWLWHGRFAKTRTLAQKLVTGGHVVLNGRPVSKPACEVRPGDTLSLTVGDVRRDVTVLALGVRRGPAPEARSLYDEPEPPRRLRPLTGVPAPRGKGMGRPTKRDRRVMERFTRGGPD